ncbi:type II secretion system protein [Anatilimnocola floriformis]|uniref:type II secretion system protein n=1 Tax=Anatilimnocola floriformis TaxID=2948575 RepID=UPI0020C37A15|nr:type II secretion system protein [Anatilimnocola floriformis]
MKSPLLYRRAAFTLIELVVVLLILAAIAGLVIPNISMLGRTTDMAVSAKTQADVANQVGLFFVLQKRYPQGMDSLLDTTGAVYAADTTNGDTQTKGLPYAGADGSRMQSQLTPATLTNATNAEYLRSLTRAGVDWVWDHDTAAVNSNLSNTGFRALVAGYSSPGIPDTAGVAGAATVAELNAIAPLVVKLNGKPLVAGERVVAFGFGQKNSAMGKTTTTVPLYPGADKTYYGRYIVFLKIYASGERATLLGVSDSYGRTPDYTQQQFNESLPDGSRQG